jgi:hypothetical protein
MANINEVFAGNYLKADDLKGKTVTVKIASAEVVEFDNGNKIVIGFEGKEKKLVLNKTNASIISENLGETETDNWIGATVSLTVKKVEFQGKLVPAIRVVLQDTPKPTVAAPAAAPAPTKPVSALDENGEVPF